MADKKEIQELRRRIYHLLDENILFKPEEQRDKIEDLVAEMGRAFGDLLLRYAVSLESGKREAVVTESEIQFARLAKNLARHFNALQQSEVNMASLRLAHDPLAEE
jgi:hypothetical protein